jgi:tetratricopeptide (TPR) repeat protein
MKYIIFFSLVILSVFFLTSCTNSAKEKNLTPISINTPLPDDSTTDEETIRFLEERVKKDPEDMISYNMLGERYLKRLRETGNLTYLTLAEKAATESLRILPSERNTVGLSLKAATKYSSHEFTSAQESAEELIKLLPGQFSYYQLLGDSLLELGEYEKAENTFKTMEKIGDDSANAKFALAVRVARIEKLKGNLSKAENSLLEALTLTSLMKTPSRETLAWTNAQVAEHYFSTGNYKKSEEYYKTALDIFPGYFLALSGLGQVKAAQGNLEEAINLYEKVVKVLPDLNFVATLGDLYKLAGKEKESEQQYSLVEQIAKLSTLNGVLYNRSLAIFYANKEINVQEAYAQAQKEYEERKDIYGADALAWTALKAGKVTEAQAAIKSALKLGTKDAKIFYHAAIISQALGDKKATESYLQEALALNPKFDLLESIKAKKILDELVNQGVS